MKNSLFDSLFSSESYVFLPLEFVLFEKVPFISLYSQTIRVWGDSQMMWDLFQTKFKCRKFAFIVSGTLACVRMHVSTYAFLSLSLSMRMHIRVCVHPP